MTDRVDISDEVKSLCRKFDVKYDVTALISFDITPGTAKVVVYKRNEHLNLYVGDDGRPASETKTFAVRT